MREITVENAVEALRIRGWLPADVIANAEFLSGGVSNVVIRVSTSAGFDWVLKQSRERLRTQNEWRSRLDRIWREAAVQRALSDHLPAGMVPRVVHEDRSEYLYVMEAIEADHVVWKTALLAGTADLQIVQQAADALATVHARTAGDETMQAAFGDVTVFDELRLDPFYRFTATRHPSLADSLGELVEETLSHRLCLVLADFSPKNILLTSRGIVLVDFETAHFGDPAFDVGFFLSHLLLKTVHQPDRREEYFPLPRLAWSSYREALQPANPVAAMTGPAMAERTVRHLAACLLARIDGKSPVDYLNETQRDMVRRFCLCLFQDQPANPEEVFARLEEELGRC